MKAHNTGGGDTRFPVGSARSLRSLVTSAVSLSLLLVPPGMSLPTPAVSDINFIDVTDQAGLADRGNVEGVSWTDYDQDGDLDVFACHHITVPPAGQSVLYRNNGDGTFTEMFRMGQLIGRPAARNNAGGKNDDHSATWGDYDNDGDPDLYISRGNSQDDSLFRNDGEGVFTDVTETAGVSDPGGRGRTASWMDVDRDGYIDLFVANNHSPNRLFHNLGDGKFEEIGARAGLAGGRSERKAVAWADYDQDGFVDLYLTESRDPRERAFDPPLSRLYRNNGDLTFTDVTTGAGLMADGPTEGACWGDFDNDGDSDLYVANESEAGRLYRNEGDGTFTEVAGGAGVDDRDQKRAATWGDYDNDGDLDLFVIMASAPERLYRNNGDGTFTDGALTAGLTVNGSVMQLGAAWGDYDRDGFLDLFLTDQRIAGGRFSHLLYRNGGNQNHWIEMKLVGVRSNRDGLGAIVTLAAGDTVQFRQQNGGSHLLSMNSTVLHFGLSGRTKIDAITITWPSGVRQELKDVAVDQYLLITEPPG